TQLAAQVAATAELVVAHHPAMRQLQAAGTHQLQAQTPAFLVGDLLGDVGLMAMLGVAGAFLGEVEAGIDERLAPWRDVGQIVADLAVIDLAEATAPLACDTARLGALLGDAVVVEDEDA